jgi:dethiobiotin synthase
MLRGLFVTGTDTNVGKTVVSAALMHRYAARVAHLRYWKPIQTGAGADDDTGCVRVLGCCRDGALLAEGVRLPHPLSPHLAARFAGTSIALAPLVEIVRRQPPQDRWIVEGAGGVLVPINRKELMVDLISRLDLPALVVSRSTLGTINHTMLTVEALRRRSCRVAGVVMVGPPDADNREAIERYADVPVIGELPPLAPLAPEALRAWAETHLDPGGELVKWLE